MRIRNRKIWIRIGAISGILGCLVDVISSTILGSRISGYSHLRSPLSQLGTQSSPVAHEIALWWEIVGVFMIVFGLSIYQAFRDKKKQAVIASVLVILYGLGEGLGSGLLPADKAGAHHSWTGIIHIFIGGIGVLGLAFFPLIMRDLLSGIRKFSMVIFMLGFIGVILFLFSHFIYEPRCFITEYKGLWQRYFITMYYIYIIVVSVKLFFIGEGR